MKIVRSDLWLCQDCMIFAVNDDLPPDSDDAHDRMIVEGVHDLGAGLVPDFYSEDQAECKLCGWIGHKQTTDICPQCHKDGLVDRDTGEKEFSVKSCDACGTHLAGSRYRFAILGEE